MKKNTKIISGFPGIGKSYLFNIRKDLFILDSDSSQFSWIEKGVRNPDFPNNYMAHIKKNIGKVDIILVSSHDVVREALKENEIDYILVYPNKLSKKEYMKRYTKRGNDEKFINMIDKNWDKFIYEMDIETFPTKIKLIDNQYLKDIFSEIVKIRYTDKGNKFINIFHKRQIKILEDTAISFRIYEKLVVKYITYGETIIDIQVEDRK